MLNTNNSNMSICTLLQIPGVYSKFFFSLYPSTSNISYNILLYIKVLKNRLYTRVGFFLCGLSVCYLGKADVLVLVEGCGVADLEDVIDG